MASIGDRDGRGGTSGRGSCGGGAGRMPNNLRRSGGMLDSSLRQENMIQIKNPAPCTLPTSFEMID